MIGQWYEWYLSAAVNGGGDALVRLWCSNNALGYMSRRDTLHIARCVRLLFCMYIT